MIIPPVVFADASFYITGINAKDPSRARAAAWLPVLVANGSRIVTTEAVLWEFLNSCSPPPTRGRALLAYERLHADPMVEAVGFEPTLIGAALDLYKRHRDKAWGIVDCYSFVVMRVRKLTAALTADHHFEQAGFAALLLRDPP